jgi:hypothetical protein
MQRHSGADAQHSLVDRALLGPPRATNDPFICGSRWSSTAGERRHSASRFDTDRFAVLAARLVPRDARLLESGFRRVVGERHVVAQSTINTFEKSR